MANLLALVPSLFGFHPAESLVLLTVGDTAPPFHARVDLPSAVASSWRVATGLPTRCSAPAPTHVAVVAYTDDAGLAHAVVDLSSTAG